jgi:hypothetical protein
MLTALVFLPALLGVLSAPRSRNQTQAKHADEPLAA